MSFALKNLNTLLGYWNDYTISKKEFQILCDAFGQNLASFSLLLPCSNVFFVPTFFVFSNNAIMSL